MSYAPYAVLSTSDGLPVPFYVVKFDKAGAFEAPWAKAAIAKVAADYTDVFFFSHGWNNDFEHAINDRYIAFFKAYDALRKTYGLPLLQAYKPLMVGIYWPATVLANHGPSLGAAPGKDEEEDYPDAQFEQDTGTIAKHLSTVGRGAFQSLLAKETLSEPEILELAELVAAGSQAAEDELFFLGGELDTKGAIAQWEHCIACAKGSALKSKKLLFDPRWLFRALTFDQMRKRAGVVGSRGVGQLLQALLSGTQSRIHLIGHSYGAKLVLSALGATSGREVQSALLLQPAISHLAFASTISGKNKAGKYHPLLNRVKAPLLSTFSKHDVSLYKRFHFYMSSEAQVGEWDDGSKAASVSPHKDSTPSRYAALGGYGPQGLDATLAAVLPLKLPGDPYMLDTAARIYGLDGQRRLINGKKRKPIGGHGKVINDYTAWALYSLVKQGAASAQSA